MASGMPWPPLESRVLRFAETGSTNADAGRRASEGAASGTWVVSDRQTAGRGRSGRDWVSQAGNLHASLILRDVSPLERAYQLSLVSGVAVHDAVSRALASHGAGAAVPPLELKWPNDILLGRAKLGGILVESSVARREEGALAVVGIGLNLAVSPEGPSLSASHLSAYAASIAPLEMLAFLDETVQEWLAVWACGGGFAGVRQAWLARALPIGAALAVQSVQGRVSGTFAGLDRDGALLLRDGAGAIASFTYGDVTLSS